ncbi:MAG: hypothetical protein AB7F99_17280 [Vicinamibacterales bacterium]
MVKTFSTLIAVLGTPGVALACPVCFGQNDSAMAVAMNSGIMLMLGIVVAVLGGFAAFIVYLVRRANLVADVPEPLVESYSGSHPQEGTARC